MCARWRLVARESCTTGLSGADDPSTWLNMFVDGMDMAKFCVPRNVTSAKSFQMITKPEIKCSVVAPRMQLVGQGRPCNIAHGIWGKETLLQDFLNDRSQRPSLRHTVSWTRTLPPRPTWI